MGAAKIAWRWGGGVVLAAAVGLGTGACSGANKGADDPDPSGLGGAAASSEAQDAEAETKAEALELGPITKTSFREHSAKVAWVFDEDPTSPKKMKIGQAEARGYTIVDLSNSWVPYIFTEKTPGVDDETPNRYRKTYVGLANDEIDSWNDKLREHERNFLELYGIPPSLEVVKQEWDSVATEVEPCLAEAGYDGEAFKRFSGTIVFKKSKRSKRVKTAKYYRAKVHAKMRKAELDPSTDEGMAAAATHPKIRGLYKTWRKSQDEVDVIANAQKRFRCERLFSSGEGGTGKFKEGHYDSATTHALASFERKHDVMGWGHFKADNVAVLALTPAEAVHARLLRVVQERVVTSTGIVEDGSATTWKKGKFRWKDKSGEEHELRDLASEFTDATVEALGLGDLASAPAQLERLSKLGEGGFKDLLVAVKLPPLPEYYSENMSFSTHIDRGDVWYDFPYTEDGRRKAQPRGRTPRLTLYVHYNEQKIPLVHWKTTIGAWRNEVKEGEVMLKYKNSDVGARVWKDIVAAPVWIPPATTPPAELIKGRWRNGKFTRGVNYQEIGPGYRSAYGLVAAYHIKQIKDDEGNVKSEFDNSIRTHGSVDYMSILRRYSHGCHRLYNMDAVRMFSFILKHREYKRLGKIAVGVGRRIEVEERTFHMKIGSRGYKYELVEPVPVSVTRGRIRGRRRSPITEYVPKPTKPEDNEITVDDGQGGVLTVPIPLPPVQP